MVLSRGKIRLNTKFMILVLAAETWSTIAAADIHSSQQEVIKNCTYLVSIETTCAERAGTSSNVSLRFGDENSNQIFLHHLNSDHAKRVDPLEPRLLDDLPRKPFQPCMLDHFLISGQCVRSPVCFLYLKLTGDDDWRPGFALVRVVDPPGSHSGSRSFYFRRYLPRKVWHGSDLCDPEVTPFGVKYRRKLIKNPNNIVN